MQIMQTVKRLFVAVFVTLAASFGAVAGEDVVTHYVAIHVDENDPKVMNMALNNAQNVTAYYEAKGEKVVIELVAYGPGLNMLVEGKSPVAERIAAMSLEMGENLTFAACGNTMRKMEAKTGQPVELLDEVGQVPSGVVRLIELQEQGYAYIRP